MLGSLLFAVHMLPLAPILKTFGPQYHFYTDDMQIHQQFNRRNPQILLSAINSLEDCIRKVGDWMVANKLMLNEQKTYFMPLVS